ncbi:unnamed protein product [Sympodiomycopsis kandeliae]
MSKDLTPGHHFHSIPTCLSPSRQISLPLITLPFPVKMGMKHAEFLSSHRVFGCKKCRAHLTTIDNLISRQFNGQHGKAYLFEFVVNIHLGEPEDRHMTTGMHTVRDIKCDKCATTMGWKYDRAFNPTEKYKEGKFILEKNLMIDVD